MTVGWVERVSAFLRPPGRVIKSNESARQSSRCLWDLIVVPNAHLTKSPKKNGILFQVFLAKKREELTTIGNFFCNYQIYSINLIVLI